MEIVSASCNSRLKYFPVLVFGTDTIKGKHLLRRLFLEACTATCPRASPGASIVGFLVQHSC